jgi:hypothetical protein
MSGNHEKICEKSFLDQVHVQHHSLQYVTPICWPPDYETAFVWTRWAWNTDYLDELDILRQHFTASDFPPVRMFYTYNQTRSPDPPPLAVHRRDVEMYLCGTLADTCIPWEHLVLYDTRLSKVLLRTA